MYTNSRQLRRSPQRGRGVYVQRSGTSTAQYLFAGIAFSLVAAVLAAIVVWRLDTRPKPVDYGIVIDPSGSNVIDCAEAGAIAKAYLNNSPKAVGSSLTVFSPGSKERDLEPLRVLEVEIPYAPTPPLGKPDRDVEAERLQLVQAVEHACQSLAPVGSPIRRAVLRSVQHLETLPGEQNHLTVMSDLDEREVDLDSSGLPAINNAQVEVTFCGFADRVKIDKSTTDMFNLQALWQAQFVAPVSFQPYCAAAVQRPLTATR